MLKIYNILTRFKYKTLHFPVKLAVRYSREVKKPKLTVVFLHGIAASSSTWQKTFEHFSDNEDLKDCRLLALDLLGFGKTLKADWLDYDYDEYVRAIRRTLRSLGVRGPMVLVGHSMGSLIAAKYANTYPKNIEKLILVSPPILMAKEVAALPDKFYWKSYSTLPEVADNPAIQTMGAFVSQLSSFRVKYLNTKAFAKAMENVVLNPGNYRIFTELKVPAIIIHGRFDPLVYKPNLARAVEHNPHLELALAMGGHDISTQKENKILKELKEVLCGAENENL